MREHLESIEARTGNTPEQLNTEDPGYFAYVWAWYCEIATGRISFGGPSPLGWEQIRAWCVLKRVELSIYELDLIKKLDMLWLEFVIEKHKEGE